jgi:hypothetical protein
MPRLGNRWATLVFHYIIRPGVICGQGQTNILVELAKAPFQIFNAAGNILLYIKSVGYSQHGRSPRHQLHESHGPLGRKGMGIEPRLLANDGPYQVLVHVILPGIFLNYFFQVLALDQVRYPGW